MGLAEYSILAEAHQIWAVAFQSGPFPNPVFARWPYGRRALFRFRGYFGAIVSRIPMAYTGATEHHMTFLNKVFTTRTLVQIIFVLTAAVILKAASLHYDFSWATALAAD